MVERTILTSTENEHFENIFITLLFTLRTESPLQEVIFHIMAYGSKSGVMSTRPPLERGLKKFINKQYCVVFCGSDSVVRYIKNWHKQKLRNCLI